MNSREFFETVLRMRYAQREYFRLQRTQASQEEKRMALIEAQHLERTIDAEIKRVQDILTNQPLQP